ncbi:MAG: hypothetical protein V4792_10275 [Pseudomonadota bacterium]
MAKLASQFVTLPPERRALAFAQTAARMSASSVMVEKDFWVCWLLGLLFADAELAPHLDELMPIKSKFGGSLLPESG